MPNLPRYPFGLEQGASLQDQHTELQLLETLWQTSDIIHLTEFVKTKPYLLAKLMRKESSMRQ